MKQYDEFPGRANLIDRLGDFCSSFEDKAFCVQYLPGTGVTRAITKALLGHKITAAICETAAMHKNQMFRAEGVFDPVNFVQIMHKARFEFVILYVDDIALAAPEFTDIVKAIIEKKELVAETPTEHLKFTFAGKLLMLHKPAHKVPDAIQELCVCVNAAS